MFKKAVLGVCLSVASASQAYAQVPRVAVDIAPLHSLVAQVMNGVGEPNLLIRPEASPHEYNLRPSEAKALSDANIVFWIGEGLTPWLEKPLETLASGATKIEMMETEGVTLYDFREGATFEAHAHHDEEGHDDDHHEDEHHDEKGHDDDHHEDEHHDEKGHDDHHEDEHHDEKGHDDHHHEGHDPHVWLDPQNAEAWVNTIAKTLSEADSDNAQAYQNNASAAIERLHQLTADIKRQAQELQGAKFIVFHDAYQYFEQRFGLLASGAISISDASDPSPARIAEIRQTVSDLGVTCVFTEPQYNPDMVQTVFEDSTVNTIGVMDPLGANIAIGKEQYSSLLVALISSLEQCK
ncbi:zinc ABC transporter substrate-binding protein [Vibrio sp. WJH972]